MNEQPQTPAQDDGVEATTTGSHAKVRPAYLESSGSESTRELRDTARRRRDAEEKLQQHLLEAKEHTPNADTHAHSSPEDAGQPEDADQRVGQREDAG
ncbi:hypothetical protein [Arthrobacter sp. HS15c]|uniref:hypothetical protein n=1 Tax=Arthrobacter sp. HS15c TaxID=3230279 RepID=UPI0034673FA3